MGKAAIDFGTSNTVVARWNQATERAEVLAIPGITTEMRYRLTPGAEETAVPVIPSLIHYSEKETLVGDQVLSRGLADHPHTHRWMKRGIAQRVTAVKKTPQGHKSPAQAGEEFLELVLRYVSDRISLADDEVTVTAPAEAFEDFQDWLYRIAERHGMKRLRLLDEPTASIFGYHGMTRQDERFLVFDFGGGTLDVSAVRIDLAAGEKKAVQLGRAGRDLGGMDLDLWIAADFKARHALEPREHRELEGVILRQAEAVKIRLSDPAEEDADMTVIVERGAKALPLRTVYTRSCGGCERGRKPQAGQAGACLGCILLSKDFLKDVRGVFERALEGAATKAGMVRDDLVKVVVTGGTSLVPAVRELLAETFDSKVAFDHPFDSVVRGAVAGDVSPLLQHDYALENYNPERKAYEFKALFKSGAEYPTSQKEPVKLWAKGSHEAMTKVALRVFEVSKMRRRDLAVSLVDQKGVLRDDCRVASEFDYICLNRENPTFIVADPPVNLARDPKRFLCSFWVDGNRRLLVTVLDNFKGETLLKHHPVVRL